MQTLKAGVLYFILVFAAGFVLGTVRILWLAPHFGTRYAELMEAPIMLAVIIFAARWVVRRVVTSTAAPRLLAVGFIALGLLLATEFSVVLWLQGLTIESYLARRDPIAGTVYLIMLGVFALMPLVAAKKRGGS